MKKNYYFYSILIAFCSIVSIYTFEFFLQLKMIKAIEGDKDKKIAAFKNKNKADFDLRSKYEVFNDLKKRNKRVSVPITYGMVINTKTYLDEKFLPLSGLTNALTLHCNENGYFSKYLSDRFGFNNNDKIWENKSDKENNVLLIGDSFLHGACVNREDSIAGKLKELNKKKNFFNLGYSENGPLQELAILREFSKEIKFSKVIWFYYESNDLDDISSGLKNDILRKYFSDQNFSQQLIQNVEKSDRLYEQILSKQLEEKVIKFHSINFSYKYFLKLSYLRKFLFKKSQNVEILNFKKIINQANQLTKDNNAEFYFVYLPDFFRYYYNQEKNQKFYNYLQVMNVIKELGIKSIDINNEVFLKHTNKLNFFPFASFGHYNELGYEAVATKVNEKIF